MPLPRTVGAATPPFVTMPSLRQFTRHHRPRVYRPSTVGGVLPSGPPANRHFGPDAHRSRPARPQQFVWVRQSRPLPGLPPAMDAARAANLALRNAQRLQLRAAVSPRVSAAVFTTAVASFSSTYLGPLSFLDSDLDFIACFNSLSPPIVSFAQNLPVHASFTTVQPEPALSDFQRPLRPAPI